MENKIPTQMEIVVPIAEPLLVEILLSILLLKNAIKDLVDPIIVLQVVVFFVEMVA